MPSLWYSCSIQDCGSLYNITVTPSAALNEVNYPEGWVRYANWGWVCDQHVHTCTLDCLPCKVYAETQYRKGHLSDGTPKCTFCSAVCTNCRPPKLSPTHTCYAACFLGMGHYRPGEA